MSNSKGLVWLRILPCLLVGGCGGRVGPCPLGSVMVGERCRRVEADGGLAIGCDGAPDAGEPCVLVEGNDCETECGSTGILACDEDCAPGDCVPPEETCNGLDDDCDGLVDEDLYAVRDRVQVSDGSSPAVSPSLAWTGSAWLVVWEDTEVDRRNVQYATVTDGVLDRPDAYLADADVRRPRLVAFGDRLGLTVQWRDPVGGGHVLGCAVDPAAMGQGIVPNRCRVLSDDATSRTAPPGIAAGPGLLGVAWVDDGPDPRRVSLAALTEEASEIGFETVVGSGRGVVSVAYDPANEVFPMVWTEEGRVWLGRVRGSGEEIGSESLLGRDEASRAPAIAWGRGGGLVAWIGDADGTSVLRFLSLDEGGAPSGGIDGGERARAPEGGSSVDVCWTGAEYAVLFPEEGDEDGSASVSVLRFVPGIGRSQEPVRLGTEGSRAGSGALAWNGEELGAVWIEDVTGQDEIWFGRIGCLPE